jgi:hypothetical protein
MAELLILEFTGIGKAEYDAINAELGIDMATGAGNWPPDLLAHAAGVSDDGTFVVSEVWESRADQGAFLESRLGPALGANGVTGMPSVRWTPLLAHHTPGA